MTTMVAKLDDMGTPVWVALLVLSFVVFWPVGLALLAFLVSSGRLGSHRGAWCSGRVSRHRERWTRPYPHGHSGNTAFEEYREQAMHRLEEEQQEFHDFLKQLRMAKDRTEFDRFMADRAAQPEDDEESDTPDEQNERDDRDEQNE
jgi:hypothetical protein